MEYAHREDPKGRLDSMIGKLKEKSYRITPQRVAVLRILAFSDDHPTIEEIHKRVKADFPMTSLATVYKNITVLKKLGEVLELGFGDDHNHYDGRNPHPHPHLICTRCKKIVDPDVESLAELPQRVAQRTGYWIMSHRLDFFGLCPDCQGNI